MCWRGSSYGATLIVDNIFTFTLILKVLRQLYKVFHSWHANLYNVFSSAKIFSIGTVAGKMSHSFTMCSIVSSPNPHSLKVYPRPCSCISWRFWCQWFHCLLRILDVHLLDRGIRRIVTVVDQCTVVGETFSFSGSFRYSNIEEHTYVPAPWMVDFHFPFDSAAISSSVWLRPYLLLKPITSLYQFLS